MSEHTWVLENIAGYIAGGLEGEERDRLTDHVAGCLDCAAVLDDMQALDRRLVPLFAAERPAPALEDRLIQALRDVPARRRALTLSWKVKAAMGIAAALLFGLVGAGVSELLESAQKNGTVRQITLANHRANDALERLPSGFEPTNDWADGAQVEFSGGVVGGKPKGEKTYSSVATTKKAKNADQLALELREQTSGLFFDSRAVGKYAPIEGKPDIGNGLATLNRPPVPTEMFDKEAKAKTDFKEEPRKPESSPQPTAPPPVTSPALGIPPGYGTSVKDSPTMTGSLMFPSRPVGGPQTPLATTGSGTGGGGFYKPGDVFNGRSGGAGGGKGEKSKEVVKSLSKETADKGKDVKDQLYRLRDDNKKDGEKKGPAPVAEGGPAGHDPQKKPADYRPGAIGPDTGGQTPPEPAQSGRKIIRTGDMEFEIDSFDSSVATVMKLVTSIKGAFVATINSDRLANGKVRGSVVVRIPPEHLDKFVLDLRKELAKTGELKNQRIGSLDITKQYTDMESRLKASRTMEERLLKIIKDGKGLIKDLLLAEKELGVWRTKIEELEGELRYYTNLVSLSTLTINLTEKEIRTAALITESERVQAGIEVEDVEKAHQDALKAILEAKGRVSRSELKQHAAGQFNAILNFEVEPENAGTLRDRLRQLGTMVRLEVDRVQQTEGGGPAPKDGKIKRGPTQFFISMYNLANIAPRETVTVRVAALDVPAAYVKLREAVGKAKGRVINAQLNEQNRQSITATLDFDVRRTGEGSLQTALGDAGEIVSRHVTRVPESDNVTDAKVLFKIELVDAGNIPPRETVTIKLSAVDVPAAYNALRDSVVKLKGRISKAQLNEQDRQNVTGYLTFDIRRPDDSTIQKALGEAGDVLSRNVNRLPDQANVTDSRVLFTVEFRQASSIPPRETVTLSLAATDVAAAYNALRDQVAKVKGRVVKAQLNEQDRQNVNADLNFDVSRPDDEVLRKALGDAGDVLSRSVNRQPESDNVTDARVLFQVKLVPATTMTPRETTTMALVVNNVSTALKEVDSDAVKAGARTVMPAQIFREESGRLTAHVIYDVPVAAVAGLIEQIKAAGRELRVFKVTPNPQAPEGKLAIARIDLLLSNVDLLVPQDAGLWSDVRHGLSVSLRGLSKSASFLIIGVLFVLPWLLLVWGLFWLVRRLWWRPEPIVATPVAGSGTPAAPAT